MRSFASKLQYSTFASLHSSVARYLSEIATVEISGLPCLPFNGARPASTGFATVKSKKKKHKLKQAYFCCSTGLVVNSDV